MALFCSRANLHTRVFCFLRGDRRGLNCCESAVRWPETGVPRSTVSMYRLPQLFSLAEVLAQDPRSSSVLSGSSVSLARRAFIVIYVVKLPTNRLRDNVGGVLLKT
jgi:hypothetical protein